MNFAKRYARVNMLKRTSALTGILVVTVGVYWTVRLYAFVLGADWNSRINHSQQIGAGILVLVTIPIYLSIGTWFWAIFAKLFLGLTRTEAEELFLSGPQLFKKFNRWCMGVLFAKER